MTQAIRRIFCYHASVLEQKVVHKVSSASPSFLRKWTSGQGFRPQPMGLCLNGQPRQPLSLLIPTVQAWQNFYGSTSAASSLALRSSFHRQG
jgi:hypothetical protein